MKYNFLRFPEGKCKAVTFSYDDGTKADIQLANILTKYGLKGTFNINSSKSHADKKLTEEEVRTHILEAGHEIAIHGEVHKALIQCSPLEGVQEVLNCRLTLEKTFGRIIRGMAYSDASPQKTPSVKTDYTKIKQYLEELGIAYARSIGMDNKLMSIEPKQTLYLT